jgi:hypothetical protein
MCTRSTRTGQRVIIIIITIIIFIIIIIIIIIIFVIIFIVSNQYAGLPGVQTAFDSLGMEPSLSEGPRAGQPETPFTRSVADRYRR